MYKFINYYFFTIKKKIILGIRPLLGRNYIGKICVHHKSGGIKKNYYLIDFYRRLNLGGFIYKILLNTIQTSFLGILIYENGLFSHILLTDNINKGDYIYSGFLNKNMLIGSTFLLKNIKLFAIISNIEKYPNSGFSLIRAAGTSAIITSINKNTANLKLKSG